MRTRTMRMAKAESAAREAGIEFVWFNDWSLNHTKEFGYEPETCESCQAIDRAGVVLASLCCIDDATPEYRRVVEAELAEEAGR